MTTTRKRIVTVLIVLAALFIAHRYFGDDDEESSAFSAAETAGLLENRIWVDVWPEAATDRFHLYQFIPSMNHSGVYQDRTLFAGEFELFLYEVLVTDDAAKVTITWPHSDRVLDLPFEISRVNGPKPFDLKLVLKGNTRGPSVLYGLSGAAGNLQLPLPGR